MTSSQAGELLLQCRRLHAAVDGWLADLTRRPVPVYDGDSARAPQQLRQWLGAAADLVVRHVQPPAVRQAVVVAFFDSLVNPQVLDQGILAPLQSTRADPAGWDRTILGGTSVQAEARWQAITEGMARGQAAVFAPGLPWVWLVDAAKPPSRAIARPETENTVRGPDEAFSELLSEQLGQIRRRLATPELRLEPLTIGRRQHLKVVVAYLYRLANPELVAAVRDRLQAVDLDGISTTTILAGLIRDHPLSLFPTIRATERVDIAIRHLLWGKVLILVDGDPFILSTPAVLADFYRTAMDYSSTWIDVTFVRFIRLIGWFLGIYLPALFVAAATVNPNMVPYSLQVAIIGGHTGLPFPVPIEALLMVIILEVLRESALRLPKAISGTIGTVGAIVVGTSVVKAGFISPQMLVITTLTMLSFFSVPVYELTGAWRLVNFAMLLAAATFGVWGIVLTSVGLVGVLTRMESFGAPYFAPWTPFFGREWADLVLRLPWARLRRRLVTPGPLEAGKTAHRPVLASPELYPPERRP